MRLHWRERLYIEERLAIARAMINEDMLSVFGDFKGKRREWVHRLLSVIDGESRAVPRKYRRRIGRRPER